jgi:hypothetical protein
LQSTKGVEAVGAIIEKAYISWLKQ